MITNLSRDDPHYRISFVPDRLFFDVGFREHYKKYLFMLSQDRITIRELMKYESQLRGLSQYVITSVVLKVMNNMVKLDLSLQDWIDIIIRIVIESNYPRPLWGDDIKVIIYIIMQYDMRGTTLFKQLKAEGLLGLADSLFFTDKFYEMVVNDRNDR
jgi:hypothetical protein